MLKNLVLTRRPGEQIIINGADGPITITLVEIRGDKTRIMTSAPESVRVDRREIHERRLAQTAA